MTGAHVNWPSDEERFWSKVDKTGECWLWTASRVPLGYGQVRFQGTTRRAHRVAWFLTHGEWPEQTLDHLCRVRHCVRPDHLEDVLHRTNVLRGTSPAAGHAVKTHCPQGHAYEGDNVRVTAGKRRCRTCHREDERRRKRQRKSLVVR